MLNRLSPCVLHRKGREQPMAALWCWMDAEFESIRNKLTGAYVDDAVVKGSLQGRAPLATLTESVCFAERECVMLWMPTFRVVSRAAASMIALAGTVSTTQGQSAVVISANAQTASTVTSAMTSGDPVSEAVLIDLVATKLSSQLSGTTVNCIDALDIASYATTAITNARIAASQPVSTGLADSVEFAIFLHLETPTNCGQDPDTQDPPPPVPLDDFEPRDADGDSVIDDPCNDDDTSDPVFLAQGDYYMDGNGDHDFNFPDLFIPGRGLDFEFRRYYRSRTGQRNGSVGHNWSHNYDVRIERPVWDDDVIALHDGTGRIDAFEELSATEYRRREYFGAMLKLPNGYWELMEHDGIRRQFYPLNGSPTAGRLSTIMDRNGNTVTLNYDAAGRLDYVIDTLGREIDFTWIELDVDGVTRNVLASVADFAGRTVSYDYYDGSTSDGSEGDLASATFPAVVTDANFTVPSAQQYASGTTWIYTYTTGFTGSNANALNHNLKTITDGRGEVYLENVYASTTTSADFLYDRVVTQYYGGAAGSGTPRYDYSYAAVTPGIGNNNASVQVFVNNRVGAVKELYFDDKNRIVLRREYMGFATPNAPTTSSSNLPGSPVRSSDPTYYEEQFDYDTNSRPVRIEASTGVVTVQTFDSSNSNPLRHGQMTSKTIYPAPGHTPSTPRTWTYTYSGNFGGCGCNGPMFPATITDPLGRVTVFEYDGAGNPEQVTLPDLVTNPISGSTMPVEYEFTHNSFGQLASITYPTGPTGRRVDEFEYYSSGDGSGYAHMIGYLKRRISDVNGIAATTTLEYDVIGGISAIIDPHGNVTYFVTNQRHQTIAARRYADSGETTIANDYVLWYDANDQLTRYDVRNADSTGTLNSSNPRYTTLLVRDVLNRIIRTYEEYGSFAVPDGAEVSTTLPTSEFVINEYDYDANGNHIAHRKGSAMDGSQTANTISWEYDPRDLLLRVEQAPGTSTGTSTFYNYTGARRVAAIIEEGVSSDRAWEAVYDGFDQAISITDPMGNELRRSYDHFGRVIQQQVWGEVSDVAGNSGNVLLSQMGFAYDELGGIAEESVMAKTHTGASIGSGTATTLRYHYPNLLVGMATDPLGNDTIFDYDGMGRLILRIDSAGNEEIAGYDAVGNRILSASVEANETTLGTEEFWTEFAFDAANRLIGMEDSAGNINVFAYNSLDGLGYVSAADTSEQTFAYDGMGRLLEHHRLRPSLSALVSKKEWDASSRLVAEIDALDRQVQYAYDAADRLISETYADGTSRSAEYNEFGDVIETLDANGSSNIQLHDANGRIYGRLITPGTTVASTTTFEAYDYDGLGRVVAAVNNASDFVRSYTTLGGISEETLNGAYTIESAFDVAGSRVGMIYPSGRTLVIDRDPLGRIREVLESSTPLATYEYAGPRRLAARALGNGIVETFGYGGEASTPNATGDYSFGRMTQHAITDGTTPLIERAYSWTPTQLKQTAEEVVGAFQRKDAYTYDSASRMTVWESEDGASASLATVGYQLDAAANRQQVTGSINPGLYNLSNVSPDPDDRKVHQYTVTPMDRRFYDLNGNLVRMLVWRPTDIDLSGETLLDDAFAVLDPITNGPIVVTSPELAALDVNEDGVVDELDFIEVMEEIGFIAVEVVMEYDYQDRMVRYTDDDRDLELEFAYDAFGRRINKYVYENETLAANYEYVHDDWQLIEQHEHVSGAEATFVYGNYIDKVLTARLKSTPIATPEDYFLHSDDLSSVVALSDDTGTILERYAYDPFGRPLDPATMSPVDDTRSAFAIPFAFTGREYDKETGWYWFRTRYLDPHAGRFTSRDTIGFWGDPSNHGHPTNYLNSLASTFVDPFGQDGPDWRADAGWRVRDTPSQVVRAIYTGDANASNAVYDAAKGAAGQWLQQSSPVRGVYVSLGENGKRKGQWSPAWQVQGEAGWSIDAGMFGAGSFAVGIQQRGRANPFSNSFNGRMYVSNGIGFGGYLGYTEDTGVQKGLGVMAFSSQNGRVRKGGVEFAIDASTRPVMAIGINRGRVGIGFLIDPSKLKNLFGLFDDDSDTTTGVVVIDPCGDM